MLIDFPEIYRKLFVIILIILMDIRFPQVLIEARQIKDYALFCLECNLIFQVLNWQPLEKLGKSLSEVSILPMPVMRHKMNVSPDYLREFAIAAANLMLGIPCKVLYEARGHLVFKLFLREKITLHRLHRYVHRLQSNLDVWIV